LNAEVLLSRALPSDSSQDETSEEFIGEWAEKRGIRDQLVIATKASSDLWRHTLMLTTVLMSPSVFDQLQAGTGWDHSQGELLRKQRQVSPHLRRGFPQEAPHLIHRHLVRALVGLDHLC